MIKPALKRNDVQAIRPDWTGADDAYSKHGTSVAGLALFGDLSNALSVPGPIKLRHRLESVKLIDGDGRDPHEPTSYGVVTQAAIAMAEYEAPSRERVVCLTITDEYSGERPTLWSTALDQSASGIGIGPVARDADEEDWPEPSDRHDQQQRLIFVSAGNIDEVTDNTATDADDNPIESPAQAWNALTIGGMTDKTQIEGEGYRDYSPLADAGERSPFSRTSIEWPHSETAIKPELVVEAGDCAVDPAGDVHPDVDSLLLLSTSPTFISRPLTTMSMTSASTPQAARMGAQVLARYPGLWPEAVRALLVHSARWTPPMWTAIRGVKTKGELRHHLRCFGYGVPDVDRALFSFANDLALVTEQTIQPHRRTESKAGALNHAHYFALPWPVSILKTMGNEQVQIRVTLSYFIEPNMGGRGAVSAAAYRSAGLRFDLKRAAETRDDFFGYVNKTDRAIRLPPRGSDSNRALGESTISGGSLHSEIWEGAAVDFADRDHLIVYPVSGWWKDLKGQNRMEEQMRYSLVVSLSTDNQSTDLYHEVEQAISNTTQTEVVIE